MTSAAYTFKNLQDQVLVECQELLALPMINRKLIKSYINRAQVEFLRATRLAQDQKDITTVANQLAYSVDSEIFQIRSVKWIDDTSADIGRRLKPWPGGYDNLPVSMSYGSPVWYWVRETQTQSAGTTLGEIGTWPIEDTASNTIRIYGYIVPASDMSADGDTPILHGNWHMALIYHTLWRLFFIASHHSKGFEKKAAVYKGLYNEMVASGLTQGSADTTDMGWNQTIDAYETGYI
jgi:hypothetical protein